MSAIFRRLIASDGQSIGTASVDAHNQSSSASNNVLPMRPSVFDVLADVSLRAPFRDTERWRASKKRVNRIGTVFVGCRVFLHHALQKSDRAKLVLSKLKHASISNLPSAGRAELY